jgi:phosphatidylethanolamine-binding protein (PEBP) family uncharacterized protein
MLTRKFAFAVLFCVSSAAFGQSEFALDWQWKKSHQCSPSSPALSISGIPDGTKSLDISMVDVDVPSYDHGGGLVAHAGGPTASIPEGALKHYRGPCPPNFTSFGHDYQFTVHALAEDGKTVLSKASKTKTFSAKTAR